MVIGVILAFASGITIVMNRTINGRLSTYLGLNGATLANYVTGLLGSVLLFFAAGMAMPGNLPHFTPSMIPWFLGGAMGVLVVAGNTYLANKVSSYMATLLVFVAQIFAGIAIDFLLLGAFSAGKLIGSFFILAGLLLSAEK